MQSLLLAMLLQPGIHLAPPQPHPAALNSYQSAFVECTQAKGRGVMEAKPDTERNVAYGVAAVECQCQLEILESSHQDLNKDTITASGRQCAAEVEKIGLEEYVRKYAERAARNIEKIKQAMLAP